jgi:hypothetical protein
MAVLRTGPDVGIAELLETGELLTAVDRPDAVDEDIYH